MARGPGKYDEIGMEVLKQTGAKGIIVMVMDGNKGSGFSVIGEPGAIEIFPQVLREMANAIEADLTTSAN
jgi:hypothetical protein